MGIEPTYPAWKAGVLPLNYTCINIAIQFSEAFLATTLNILHGNMAVVNTFAKFFSNT